MRPLHLPTAVAALRVLAAGGIHNDIAELGITADDYDLVRQDEVWRVEDEPKVVKTLELMLHGATRSVGLPDVDHPAEYVASVIALVVHPGNFALAAHWLCRRMQIQRAIDAGDASAEFAPVNYNQLWNMAAQLACDPGASDAQKRMESRFAARFQAAKHGRRKATNPNV